MRQYKYNVAPKAERTIDGIIFASKTEAERYGALRIAEKTGLIAGLQTQPAFAIIDATPRSRAHRYTADFRYTENGEVVVEEVKGCFTTDYKLRRDLFLLRYPDICFREIHNGITTEYPPAGRVVEITHGEHQGHILRSPVGARTGNIGVLMEALKVWRQEK